MTELAAAVVEVCERALREQGALDASGDLSDEALRALMAWLVRTHSQRIQKRLDDGRPVPAPFDDTSGVSETDALLVARSFLEAFELAPFELAMLPR